MPVVSDLKRRHVLRFVQGALEIDRVFRVSGILGSPEDILFNALNFVGIPDLGDPYPGRPDYRVRSFNVFPDDKADCALVVVTYSDKTGPTWQQPTPTPGDDGLDVKQISTSTAEYEVTTDRDGLPMSFPPPPSYSTFPSHIGRAKLKIAVSTLVFERVETEPGADRARNLVGHLNDAAIGPYAAETLYFERYDKQSSDGGRVWRGTYEFTFQSAVLWKFRGRWARPDGKIPDDSPELAFNTIPVADFSVLNLDFSDSQTPIP